MNLVFTPFLICLGSLVCLLLALLFAFYLYHRSARRSVGNVSEGLKKHIQGDYSVRIPIVSKGPFGALEKHFNKMAEKSEELVSDLRRLDQLEAEFLSTVSHELRTPLTSISGYVKLFLSGDVGEITQTQREFLSIIDSNVTRLNHLINDLLEVEKIDQGHVQINREPFEIGSILLECNATFAILAKQKGLEIIYKPSQQPIYVIGDRPRLVQIFMNLLSNAIKYTEKGFVEIEVLEKSYAVVVRVRDTGIGFVPEEQVKLFQKFYRTRSAVHSVEGGTGLGLAIVKGLVELHGGTVSVESESGKGSVFSINLPKALAKDVDSSVAKTDVASSDGQRAVTASDFQELWVIGGSQTELKKIHSVFDSPALEQFRLRPKYFNRIGNLSDSSGKPSLVLCFEIPDCLIGESVLQLRSKFGRDIPVIVVGENIDTKTVFSKGASAVLSKPLRKDQFLNSIRNLMSHTSWRILVADVNTDMRLLIKRSLKQHGFDVDDVDNGKLFLENLEKGDYDLALVDVHMPDISHKELFNMILGEKKLFSIPIFMISDNRDPLSKDELRAHSAGRFLSKALGVEPIVYQVSKVLQGGEVNND